MAVMPLIAILNCQIDVHAVEVLPVLQPISYTGNFLPESLQEEADELNKRVLGI
jgi:hypothetical protein